MTLPSLIIIKNKDYYLADDMYVFDNIYFGNIIKRDVIKKKKLEESNYIFAYLKKDGWTLSNETYNKAKILLTKEWCDTHIPKLINLNSSAITLSNSSAITLSNSDLNNLYDILPAPNLLDIENEEKFKDKDGNIIDIEIRGDRNHKNCYFKVKDVSDGFKLQFLDKNLIDKDGSYIKEKHYKYFIVENRINNSKNIDKKVLYLTYLGMLKVLFSSRSGNAETFQEWVTETLFTVHLGTDENKYELVKSMFGGASIHAIKEAFKVSSGKTPCVYLFVVGSAKRLIDSNKYSDDHLLLKYGYTDDLPRRSAEHERNYRKIFNIDHIELICFSVIDPKYTTDAETSIANYFKTDKVEFNTAKELVILNKVDLDKTKKHFNMVKNSYIGCYKEMQEMINQLEQRLKEEQNKHELTKKDYEYFQKESIKELELTKEKLTNELELTKERLTNELKLKDKELELKDKDIEFINMKVRILEMEIKHK